jgi:hypothetical protein
MEISSYLGTNDTTIVAAALTPSVTLTLEVSAEVTEPTTVSYHKMFLNTVILNDFLFPESKCWSSSFSKHPLQYHHGN